jgi:thioredoxin-related protein
MKLLTALLIIVALFGCSSKPSVKMPSFNLLLADSTTYLNTKNIPSGKPIVLFYYYTYCEHCRAQLDGIIKDMNIMKDLNFYMITNASYADVKSFYKEYHLEKYPNITMAMDYTNFVPDSFKIQGVPFLAVYDKDKKLQQTFSGRVDNHELLKSAKNSGIHLF